MRLTLLTDKKNRIVKKYINKNLDIQGGEHLADGLGQTLDIPLSDLPDVIRNMNQRQCLSLGFVEFVGDGEYPIKSVKNAGDGDVTRTKDWFTFGEGMYFDFDGFDGTMEDGVELLCSIDNNLNSAALLGIYSSSGMLFDTETGEKLSKKSNFHIYIEGDDGSLVQEYCAIIFNRLILKGLGRVMVFANTGAKRIKTIIDETVWSSPNREIFEADPITCDGVESRRLDHIEYEDGEILNISNSIEQLRLTKEEEIKLALIKDELKNDEDVVKESEEQKAIGRKIRAETRSKHNDRKIKLESKRTVSDEEWEDNNGVLHCYLGANDWIKDSNGNDVQVRDLLDDPDSWNNKPLPDPLDPYKRGDESTGTVGQGIAYVRVNDNESMHIFSFWGDVEYHLIWDMESTLEVIAELNDNRDQDELDAFVDYVFSPDATNHRFTTTEINTIGRAIAEANKNINSGTSTFGTDARAVPAELKRMTSDRDVTEDAERAENVDESHIVKLNSKHGVCLVGGKARVVSEVFNSELNEWKPEFVAINEHKVVEKNKRVIKNVAGKLKSVGIIDDWELNPKRNTYDRVVFKPTNDLFRGCGCKPIIKQGGEYNQFMGYLANLDNAKRCKKILWHIRYVWCSGNTEMFLYTLKWLSELFKYPDKVGAPYLVLKSMQGAGKNVVIDKVICRLLGAHAISTSNKEDLLGRFNSHLGINLFLFLDEAIFAGDPRSKNLMKSLINEFRVIEQKGIDKEKGKNYTKIMMATNEEHAANIEFTDRRHVYLPVSDEFKDDKQYFKELVMEIDNGGREAFLKFMLNHESKINLNVMPDGQSDQREADMLKSERPAVRFMFELIEHGPEQFDTADYAFSQLEFKDWDTKAIVISKPKLFKMFTQYCRMSGIKLVHTDVTEFMRELSSRGLYAGETKTRKRGLNGMPGKDEICHVFGRAREVRFEARNKDLVTTE